jgi:hypothetical protein
VDRDRAVGGSPRRGGVRLLQPDDQIVEARGPFRIFIRSAGTVAGLLFSALRAGRALTWRNAATSALADPWVINLGSSAGKCYRGDDAEVQVALGPGRPEGVYRITAADDERQLAYLRLVPGGPAQAWPVMMLPLRSDAEYLVTDPSDRPAGTIRLRRVDATGRDLKEAAADLLAAGCTEQAIALVRALPPDERVGGPP